MVATLLRLIRPQLRKFSPLGLQDEAAGSQLTGLEPCIVAKQDLQGKTAETFLIIERQVICKTQPAQALSTILQFCAKLVTVVV